jgi:hypothetical protein
VGSSNRELLYDPNAAWFSSFNATREEGTEGGLGPREPHHFPCFVARQDPTILKDYGVLIHIAYLQVPTFFVKFRNVRPRCTLEIAGFSGHSNLMEAWVLVIIFGAASRAAGEGQCITSIEDYRIVKTGSVGSVTLT